MPPTSPARPWRKLVAVPKETASDPETAARLVGKAFPDLDAVLVAASAGEAGDAWEFRLRRGEGAALHDPALPGNLARMLELDFDGMFEWRTLERQNGILWLEAFQHAWALWAWSTWLAGAGDDQPSPTLLRFDAHDDLGSPMLFATAVRGRFATPFGSDVLDLRKPASVDRSIRSGVVGIGSFLLPWLWGRGGTRVLHGVPEHIPCLPPARRWLRRTPLSPGSPYGLLSQPARGPADEETAKDWGAFDYAQFVRLTDVEVPDGTVLFLDVDLDYFALVPSRRGMAARPAGGAEVQRAIREWARDLGRSSLPRPSVVTVAYSPGFFPSDWWADALTVLRTELLHVFS